MRLEGNGLNIVLRYCFAGNAELCRQITSAQTMRDVEWSSQYCSISFQTIGIWSETNDGTDINSVGRNTDRTMLATGDDSGRVKLYVYPTWQPKVREQLLSKTIPIINATNFVPFSVAVPLLRRPQQSCHVRSIHERRCAIDYDRRKRY